ncbi:MAG: hypothetical protein COA33_001750 [Fluviicola sp.]|nr:hypothetical protein [Fluviicola sp.]
MKITPTIILFLFFMSCQSDRLTEKEGKTIVQMENDDEQPKLGTSETKVITGLSFPSWIKGVWRNTAESNTNNFVTYVFYNDQLGITQGVSFKNGHKMSVPYENYSISEKATDSTYSIHIVQENHSVDYEFILQKLDWTEEPGLTYSIMENGELKRVHLTSIQLVLMKTQ